MGHYSGMGIRIPAHGPRPSYPMSSQRIPGIPGIQCRLEDVGTTARQEFSHSNRHSEMSPLSPTKRWKSFSARKMATTFRGPPVPALHLEDLLHIQT
eukprot:1346088-Amorphochlora_amoeboformis.AAC.1